MPLRLVIVTPFLEARGGMERVVLKLAQHFDHGRIDMSPSETPESEAEQLKYRAVCGHHGERVSVQAPRDASLLET